MFMPQLITIIYANRVCVNKLFKLSLPVGYGKTEIQSWRVGERRVVWRALRLIVAPQQLSHQDVPLVQSVLDIWWERAGCRHTGTRHKINEVQCLWRIYQRSSVYNYEMNIMRR